MKDVCRNEIVNDNEKCVECLFKYKFAVRKIEREPGVFEWQSDSRVEVMLSKMSD